MAKNESKTQTTSIDVGKPVAPTVDWDDSQMSSTYANVVNASSTREEVTLFFGTNQTWNPTSDRKFHVKLTDRIVLSPYAGKRLWILLGAILGEYESRFGKLEVDGVSGSAIATASKPGKGGNGTGSRAQSGTKSTPADSD